MADEKISTTDHEHEFVFLRQEIRDDGGGWRPNRIQEDIYFCSKCLIYKKIKVADYWPEGGGSGYVRRPV